MKYAKIIVKNNYEKRGDLVLRSYIRALKKIYETRLIDGENALIYGVIDDNNEFHELFTNEVINYDDYIYVDTVEIFDTLMASDNQKKLLNKIMEKVLFGKDISIDFEISTTEELAKDRTIEFEAYNNYLSRINPYQRLNDNPNLYNNYNNFLYKIEKLNEMKRMDSRTRQEFDEYEVLENPRKLVKKIM